MQHSSGIQQEDVGRITRSAKAAGHRPGRGSRAPVNDPDAVVVGSGPNGLVAAVTLAGAGWRVLVVEAADEPGGGARSAELTGPGASHDVCSAIHPLGVGSPALRSLPLAEHGLEWVHPEAPLAHVLDGGRVAVLERSVPATAARSRRRRPGLPVALRAVRAVRSRPHRQLDGSVRAAAPPPGPPGPVRLGGDQAGEPGGPSLRHGGGGGAVRRAGGPFVPAAAVARHRRLRARPGRPRPPGRVAGGQGRVGRHRRRPGVAARVPGRHRGVRTSGAGAVRAAPVTGGGARPHPPAGAGGRR